MEEWKRFQPAMRLEDIQEAQDRARAQTKASMIHTLDVKTRAMVAAMVSTIMEPRLKAECTALLNAQRKVLMDLWRADKEVEDVDIDTFVNHHLEDCSFAFQLIMDRLNQSGSSSGHVT